jgi:ribonuclease Z
MRKWHLFKLIIALIVFLALLSTGPAQQTSAMRLILLGVGYPYPSTDRAGPSCAVIIGERVFIVDAGRGVTMRLAALGNPWSSISATFITHLHSDHIDGLPDLFHCGWEFGKGTPFELYGPKGIKQVSEGILQLYGPDIVVRRDLTEKLSPEGARINAHEIQEGVILNLPGVVKVTAFLVDHPPVTPSFGYRFDAGKRSIVISGDTRPCDNLVRFAQDADILVHEAYVRKSSAPDDPKHWSIYKYHTSAREAGEIAEKAKVKTLILTHLIPSGAPDQEFLDEAKKTFSGKIVVGHDLTNLRLDD